MGRFIEGFPDSDADFLRLRSQFDLSSNGIIKANLDDLKNSTKLPTIEGLGQIIVSNMVLHGIKPGEAMGWNLLIVDRSREDDVPDDLVRNPMETLQDTEYDVWINMLNPGDPEELGELILERLENDAYVLVRGT